MASEEERAKIMAEYKASLEAGEDDEDDFDPTADDSEADEDDDDQPAASQDCAVLTGSMHLNEEGRLVYSGTWCMKSQLDTNPMAVSDSKGKKKNPKFKLRSKDSFDPPSFEKTDKTGRAMFDLKRPTVKKLDSAGLPAQRLIIFDGFFFEQAPADGSDKHGKKIKEKDVEIGITCDDADAISGPYYRVAGRGSNEYGTFVIEGTYTQPPAGLGPIIQLNGSASKKDEDDTTSPKRSANKGPCATVICEKRYAFSAPAKRFADEDDSFDDDFDDKADWGEAMDLQEEAQMSIEELKRKYYGGGGEDNAKDGDGGGKVSAAKKARLEESDDEYAF